MRLNLNKYCVLIGSDCKKKGCRGLGGEEATKSLVHNFWVCLSSGSFHYRTL